MEYIFRLIAWVIPTKWMTSELGRRYKQRHEQCFVIVLVDRLTTTTVRSGAYKGKEFFEGEGIIHMSISKRQWGIVSEQVEDKIEVENLIKETTA